MLDRRIVLRCSMLESGVSIREHPNGSWFDEQSRVQINVKPARRY